MTKIFINFFSFYSFLLKSKNKERKKEREKREEKRNLILCVLENLFFN